MGRAELGFEPNTTIVILPVGDLPLLVKRAARMSWTGGVGKTTSQVTQNTVAIQVVSHHPDILAKRHVEVTVTFDFYEHLPEKLYQNDFKDC